MAEKSQCFKTIHLDRKSTRLNSSHLVISYAVFCLKKRYIIFSFFTYALFQPFEQLSLDPAYCLLSNTLSAACDIQVCVCILLMLCVIIVFLKRAQPHKSTLPPHPTLFQ